MSKKIFFKKGSYEYYTWRKESEKLTGLVFGDDTGGPAIITNPDPPTSKTQAAWIILERDGTLNLAKGYAWDGPSGPAIDTKNFMRGALYHDALYQLMREGRIPGSNRKRADEILRETCIEDGMSRLRAWWVYQGVRLAAGRMAKPSSVRPVLTAP